MIVVTHQSAPVLEPCLERLAGRDDIELIVVDNASTDGSAAIARRATPQVLVQERNLGLAVAANAGARVARADRLCFLNPDCVLEDGCLEAAAEAWAAQPDACLVPDLSEHGRRIPGRQPGYTRRKILRDLLESRGRAPRLRAWLESTSGFHDPRWHWPHGACVFLPRRLFEAVGGFDERHFLYMEDCTLGWRLHRLGATLVSLPVVVAHGGSAGSSIDLEERLALLDAGRLRYAALHHGRATERALRAARSLCWHAP